MRRSTRPWSNWINDTKGTHVRWWCSCWPGPECRSRCQRNKRAGPFLDWCLQWCGPDDEWCRSWAACLRRKVTRWASVLPLRCKPRPRCVLRLWGLTAGRSVAAKNDIRFTLQSSRRSKHIPNNNSSTASFHQVIFKNRKCSPTFSLGRRTHSQLLYTHGMCKMQIFKTTRLQVCE